MKRWRCWKLKTSMQKSGLLNDFNDALSKPGCNAGIHGSSPSHDYIFICRKNPGRPYVAVNG